MENTVLNRARSAALLAAGVLMLVTAAASGQNYPGRPVRLMTTEAGGSNDFTARVVAQGISGPLGQQVIVENHGGNVIVLAQTLASAQPDGYTALLGSGSVWVAPLLQRAPYDPVKDFAPVTVVARAPNVLVVNPSLAAASVSELIALAKSKPGSLNFASGEAGSTTHLAGELFKSMAGINIIGVPYKGAGPALNAVIGGDVQMMFAAGSAAAPHINSGRVKVLAVTTATPSALFPGLPTVALSLPGFEAVAILSMWVPAKTPAAIVSRLNQETVRFLKTPQAGELLLKQGMEPVASTPDELAATMKTDMARLGKVIKDAGIKID
jgi:tripartite-type tricarboxylate transporter receptor subunit TctC